MDIKANVQMVLDRNLEPYLDKANDLELLLQFHD